MAKHAKAVTGEVIKLELAAARSRGMNLSLFDVAAAFGRTRPIGRTDSKHGVARTAQLVK